MAICASGCNIASLPLAISERFDRVSCPRLGSVVLEAVRVLFYASTGEIRVSLLRELGVMTNSRILLKAVLHRSTVVDISVATGTGFRLRILLSNREADIRLDPLPEQAGAGADIGRNCSRAFRFGLIE